MSSSNLESCLLENHKNPWGSRGSSSVPAFDENHFFNFEAFTTYIKCLGKSLLAERGFDFDSFRLGDNFWGR